MHNLNLIETLTQISNTEPKMKKIEKETTG